MKIGDLPQEISIFREERLKAENRLIEAKDMIASSLILRKVICGHYVYYDEEVKEAIGRLYSNLKKYRLFENPEAYVMEAVKKAIMRYVDAFNLRGSTSKIIKTTKSL